MEIVTELGFEVEPKASFWKVAAGGRAIYVAKTQKVSRVDISGFDFKHPAVKHLTPEEAHEKKLGRVRAQIDFTKSDDRVIEAFRTALNLMRHLAETENAGETPATAKAANRKARKAAVEAKAQAAKEAKKAKSAEHEASH
jgi:hypothetical protein